MADLGNVLKTIGEFSMWPNLRQRISDIERKLENKDITLLKSLLDDEDIGDKTIRAALEIKQLAGQINVFIHAVGILISLPHILESDERILYLSLGAGNTGRKFDLETNKRVAEFEKNWRNVEFRRKIVSGKEFFAKLNTWLNSKYHVRITVRYAISSMKAEEINTEILEVIREFIQVVKS